MIYGESYEQVKKSATVKDLMGKRKSKKKANPKQNYSDGAMEMAMKKMNMAMNNYE